MKRFALILGLLTVAALQPAAHADPLITGVMNTIGIATFDLADIGFVGSQININGPAAAQQGGFTALAGTTGTIQPIASPTGATGPVAVPSFVTFAANPNISLNLTYIYAGIDGAAGCSLTVAAAGQICTPNSPSQSPYNFQNTSATSSTMSFNIVGTEVDNTTLSSIPIIGAFTMPFANMNYQQILALLDGGGTVTTSFAAQFVTTQELAPSVPEPTTLIESLGGLDLIALFERRKYNKRRKSYRYTE